MTQPLSLSRFVLCRYRDGFINEAPKLPMCQNGETKNCTFRAVPDSVPTGYSDSWYARIVGDSDNADVSTPNHTLY